MQAVDVLVSSFPAGVFDEVYPTRGALGLILSAQMPTRTVHFWEAESHLDIQDDWRVRLLELSAGGGALIIHCERPV